MTLDVQVGLTGDVAVSVAIDLATEQAECLKSEEPFDSMTTLAGPAGAGEAWRTRLCVPVRR